MRKHLRTTLLAGAALIALPLAAHAGPTYTFSTSTGVQPSNVGSITLTQINSTTVDVLVSLSDTTLPAPQYGFLNTGGPHTPFAFTLAGTESGVSATFITPPGGVYGPGTGTGTFTLSTTDGGATPFGTFGISINDSAGNGSDKAYYGPLEFHVIRTSGLSIDDFVTNGVNGYYFAADLTNGKSDDGEEDANGNTGNTGSQAWKIRTSCEGASCTPSVPEPASIALLGVGLLGLGMVTARRRNRV